MAPKQNAFITFVKEWRQRNCPEISFQEAIKTAGTFWKKMSEEEREPYRQKCKHSNRTIQTSSQKLTCVGIPVVTVAKKQSALIAEQKKQKHYISNAVQHSLQTDEFKSYKYHFIMVNYFIKKIKTEIYIPAELSVSEYSLNLGVNRIFHTLINPGNCLYGQVYEASHLSEKTHNLPLPPHALGDKNLRGIFENISKFLKEEKNTNDYPPLYTLTEDIPIIESALNYLQTNDADGQDPIELKIYPIEYLFYVMKMTANGNQNRIEHEEDKENIISYFTRDRFEYSSDIGCEFHEDRDRSNFCTRSYVIRWGYMFSEYIGRNLNIKLLPGRHLPNTHNMDSLCDELTEAVDNICLQETGNSRGNHLRRGCSRADLLRLYNTQDLNKLG